MTNKSTCNWQLKAVLTAGLLFIPTALWANGLTPLMTAGINHLVLGNLFIGILEGLLIALLFKVKVIKACGMMVLANYFSMICGSIIFMGIAGSNLAGTLWHVPLRYLDQFIYINIVVIFVLTVLFEWPFVRFALKNENRKSRLLLNTSLKASIIAQAASYAVLVPFYLSVSSTGLPPSIQFDNSLTFVKGNPAIIHYVADDGDVYRINIDGSERRKVFHPKIKITKLVAKPSEDGKYWSLYDSDGRGKLLLESFEKRPEGRFERDFYIDLRPEDQVDWEITIRNYQWERGPTMVNEYTGERMDMTVETAVAFWRASSFTILPDNIVVYQLDDQILVLDLNKRKIGQLARGEMPVAVIPDER
ncbi:MAG TPA: hypothetical protein PLP86_10245 [Armatimonadota bacterium]|nr:hypothetical protein [Armatimonadota bacterium]